MPLLADEDETVAAAYGVLARAALVRRSIFVIDEEGVVRYRHVALLGLSYQDVEDLEAVARAGARRGAGLTPRPAIAAAPSSRSRPAPGAARRRARGGAADRPLPRDHRDPALRRPRLQGAGARGPPADHLRRPRPRRVRSRPAGRGLWIPASWSATWTRWSPPRWAEARFVLAGHSMGAHTAVAYALAHPERLAGLVVIGPVYTGFVDAEALAYWDGLADGLERGGVDGFVEAYRPAGLDPAWRETVLRFTRERMLLHRHPEAVPGAARGAALAAVRVARGARVPRRAGAGRRQPRRRRSRPSLRGRRGLRGAAARARA